MTQDEAVKEAANHLKLFRKWADQGVKARRIREDEVDDIVQDMYLAAVGALQSYNPNKSAISTYLTLPCVGVIGKHVGKFGRHIGKLKRHAALSQTKVHHDIVLEHKPRTMRVYDCVLQLHCRGLNGREIAASIGGSAKTSTNGVRKVAAAIRSVAA